MTRLSDSGAALLTNSALRVNTRPASEWRYAATAWDELFRQTQCSSVFLTRTWTQTWLEIYGDLLDVSILSFEESGRTVAMCLLTGSEERRGMVPIRRLSLNASGERTEESTYIEYNGVLCLKGYEEAVGCALAAHVAELEFDEFALDGIVPGPVCAAIDESMVGFQRSAVTKPSYFIDLGSLRRSGRSFAASLRPHDRTRLRRYIREYSRIGALRFSTATSSGEALAMLMELARFNRTRIAALGGRSSFESSRFMAFHSRFIEASFDQGLAQLMSVRAGDVTVGLLYNLCLGGRACFYQSGYNYEVAPQLSPGLVAHAHGIQHATDDGFDDWDFLAGDSHFKRSLSTGARELLWVVFRRPNWKNAVLRAGRAAKRATAALLYRKARDRARRSEP